MVGEDVDLLILLTARTPIDKVIYFLKPGRPQQRTEMYSSKSLSAYLKMPKLYFIFKCDNRLRYYISNVQKRQNISNEII